MTIKHTRYSRYAVGGTTTSAGTTTGWWERTTFKKSPLDVTFTITKKYAYRPDLVAFDMFGDTSLMWVVMQYNNVIDTFSDFVEGTVITLPTKGRLFGELLSKVS
jgi:hypothetical protein